MSNITGRVRPLREIWFEPELNVSRVAHENPGYRIIVLPVLASFAIWPGLLLAGFDPEDPVGVFWQGLLSLNFTVELPLQFVTAWMLFASSRRFGGRASFNAIVSALAWSRLPIAVLTGLALSLTWLSIGTEETPSTTCSMAPRSMSASGANDHELERATVCERQ